MSDEAKPAMAFGDLIDRIDLDDMTIDEVDTLERISGRPIDSLFAEDAPKAKVMRAVAYVLGHRLDPDFTVEDAGQVRIDLTTEGGEDNSEQVDPTERLGTDHGEAV